MAVNELFRVKIVNVRPKKGALNVVSFSEYAAKRKIEVTLDRIEHLLREYDDNLPMGGFAFVAWDTSGQSSADCANFSGPVTSISIPDFARNRLFASVVLKWANQDARAMLGYTDDPSG